MTSVIILAAGGSRRMGQPKALLRLTSGQSLLAAHLNAYAGSVEQLIVVGGSEFDSLRPMCEAVGAVLLRNLKWQSTMPIDTLRIGVERVRGQRCLVTPVDTVPVSDQDLSGLLACRGAALLVHRGAPGHPVLLGGEELAKLRAEAWQGTLRDLLVEAEHVPSPRPAICLNMNRPEDWRHWQSTGFA